ncbi:hypothetical protein LLG10_00255 [bacterium]|nr:hypothetical protein [bacterium]
MNLNRKSIIPGLLLIATGLFIFFYQWQGWSLSWLSWPYYLILPGIFMIILSWFNEGDTGEGFSIFGFILTTIGGILCFQNQTNLWETWAYMWTLIPLSVGLGQILHALIFPNPNKTREGFRTFRTGLILFIIFAIGFEFLIFRRNYFIRSHGFAILIILTGLLIVFKSTGKKIDKPKSHVKHDEKLSNQDLSSEETENEI